MDVRWPLFAACKKSILSQEGEFEWVISIDQRTPERYIQRICTDSRISIIHKEINRVFEDKRIDADWVITSRIDCDDQYLPGAVKGIQARFEPMLKVIDIGSYKLDWNTGNVYRYDKRYPLSMFVSLIEPSSRALSVYCRPHGQVAGGYPMEGWYGSLDKFTAIPSEIIGKRYALMVCHDNNITNSISGEVVCNVKEL
jgi:hypothetical protein